MMILRTRLKNLFIVVFILQFFSVVLSTQAQDSNLPHTAPDLKFTHLTSEDGLSGSIVSAIVQDHQGFIWMTTTSGLNRYDGYDFKTYKHDLEDETTIGNDYLWTLLVDSANNLWVATATNGLDLYDPSTDSFIHFHADPNDPTRLPHANLKILYEDSDGTLWVGGSGGLSRFNRETSEFFTYRHDPDNPNSLGSDRTVTIFEDRESGLLWFGHQNNGGVVSFDRETGTFTRYIHDPDDPTSLSNDNVNNVFQDRDGNLWMSTSGGLNRYDRETDTFIHYLHDPDDPTSLSSNGVLTSYQDSQGRFWVGTREGLNLFDAQQETFARYYHDPDDADSLNGDYIGMIFEDDSGAVWFTGGGANRLASEPDKFVTYQYNSNNPNSLAGDRVRTIYIANNNDVWVGTDTGLNHFNPQTGAFTRYQHDPEDPTSISYDNITIMTEDSFGGLWVGTRDGLNYFDGEIFTQYVHDAQDPESIGENLIQGLATDNKGGLWIAVYGSGLDYFNGETFTHYRVDESDPSSIKGPWIGKLIQDSNENIWAADASGHGLLQVDTTTETLTYFPLDPEFPDTPSRNIATDFYLDDSSMLWVGTLSGLVLFDPAREQVVRRYTTKDGLADNSVADVDGDDQGQLWVSTINGLSRFDLESQTFRNYDEIDGLQSNEFYISSLAKSSEGQMFAGGPNGLNAFYPSQLQDNPYPPPVVLTGFELFDQPVIPGAENSPLKQIINLTDELVLSYEQSVFTISFAALNYTLPEKNQYAYMMEGFDNDWRSTTPDRRFATYTNLDPGNYTFRVKASNNDGLWNEEGVSLDITVMPPWWETTLFRVVLGILAIGIIVGGIFVQRRNAIRRERILEIQVADRTAELLIARDEANAANQAKSIFLANMSHELRSPLNAVLGFSRLTLQLPNLNDKVTKNLGIVQRSGEHLLTVINDILDLIKIEAGRVSLNLSVFDLYSLLPNIEDMFGIRAEVKELQIITKQEPDLPRYIQTDVVKLRQILINLMGNAIKFTDSGQVILSISLAKRLGDTVTLVFAITDSGKGIAEDELTTIFEAFGQSSSGRESGEGTGLGLPISRKFVQMLGGDIDVDSTVDVGTTFSFSIQADVITANVPESKQPQHRIIGRVERQTSRRILIVDDHWENRQLLVQLLIPLGFEIKEAENGQVAVELFKTWQPHCILMDMRMPFMDGYEATQQIKATTQGQATTIIAVTASSMEEEKAVILSAGCDGYLRKPLKEADLFLLLTQHLGVEFEYEDISDSHQLLGGVNLIKALPSDIKQELEEAIRNLDAEQIKHIVDKIQVRNANVALSVTQLTNRFDYEQLLELLK